MHFEAGVGFDGLSGTFAACAEALDGPADFGAVGGGEVAAAVGEEIAAKARGVEGCSGVEGG